MERLWIYLYACGCVVSNRRCRWIPYRRRCTNSVWRPNDTSCVGWGASEEWNSLSRGGRWTWTDRLDRLRWSESTNWPPNWLHFLFYSIWWSDCVEFATRNPIRIRRGSNPCPHDRESTGSWYRVHRWRIQAVRHSASPTVRKCPGKPPKNEEFQNTISNICRVTFQCLTYPLLENGNADLEVGNGFVVRLVHRHGAVGLLLLLLLMLLLRRRSARVKAANRFQMRNWRWRWIDGARRHLWRAELNIHQRWLIDGQRSQQSRRAEVAQSAQGIRIVGGSAATVRLGNGRISAGRCRVDAGMLFVRLLLLMMVESVLLLLLLLLLLMGIGKNVDTRLDRETQLQSGDLINIRTERVLVVRAHVRIVSQFE